MATIVPAGSIPIGITEAGVSPGVLGLRLAPAAEAVLRLVALKPGILATEVMEELEGAGVKSYDVREAIWSLLDEDLLRLTPDWRLHTVAR